MIFRDFGMDTASLAGSLESKLAAIRRAGFAQVLISAADIVGHPGGLEAGARVVRESGLAVTGLEALRDFEGLSGRLHAYKVDVAKSMLEVCAALGGRLLLVEASCSTHADASPDAIVRDLQMLAILGIPLGIRIAFKGDAFDVLARHKSLDDLQATDPEQIFLVQLSDYMWHEIRSAEEEASTATHFRVFPGEGAHSDELARFVRALDDVGYRGEWSFDVYNDDYQQMPAETVVRRARSAAEWLAETVLRRALPVPNLEALRRGPQ
jgi:sugar phosphate isomerase/epimerase